VKAELRRRGWAVGRERVQRWMREDNLLCLRRRKFVVTTDSGHNRRAYPNVACDLVLSDINQLWVADITYVRLETEFVYLALEMRRPSPGLVHHSDRGSQYASMDYADLLKLHGCQISMSHKASPWENAGCESWMKTLKSEEVYRQEYRDVEEARVSIARFIEKVYNQKRLHSALGYRPPAEFERALSAAAGGEARG
jgi:transposase InsO family protein